MSKSPFEDEGNIPPKRKRDAMSRMLYHSRPYWHLNTNVSEVKLAVK